MPYPPTLAAASQRLTTIPLQKLLLETEKTLEKWKHPDKYTPPTAPGGEIPLDPPTDVPDTPVSNAPPVSRIQVRAQHALPDPHRSRYEEFPRLNGVGCPRMWRVDIRPGRCSAGVQSNPRVPFVSNACLCDCGRELMTIMQVSSWCFHRRAQLTLIKQTRRVKPTLARASPHQPHPPPRPRHPHHPTTTTTTTTPHQTPLRCQTLTSPPTMPIRLTISTPSLPPFQSPPQTPARVLCRLDPYHATPSLTCCYTLRPCREP